MARTRDLSATPFPAFIRALFAAASLPLAYAFGEAQKYLIVSSPGTHRVAYLKLPITGAPAALGEPMRVLIETELSVPQGLAVDQYRKRLFVADPDLNGLAAYSIVHVDDALTVGKRHMVAQNVETRWVAVDGVGNVYLTDESNDNILKLPAKAIDSVFDGGSVEQAQIIYNGSTHEAVRSPGGIGTDNFFVYWLNKASGTSVGSVIRGPATPPIAANSPGLLALSKNSMKSYGICLSNRNAFYSDEHSNLYAVSRRGGNPSIVSSSFTEPRGCAFDGDGTAYVADKGRNAVYSFAANAGSFDGAAQVDKAADLLGAFGVAMYIRVVE
eukprot:TRINITY_DN70649_c0_g1_i1.p1 TRINITY_DN70649_c0_g1~~TRINITY_DN70649_c0_g1_i1.p1  ORF type:complete len:328 (+),score=54.34 TRINITY_DN70649_c0_g1_i1:135-1118(+)